MTDLTLPAFVWFPGADRADLLTDADWQRVEAELIANPLAGQVIKGLGGARKLRVRVGNRGKSGSARTIYVYVVRASAVYFLATYAKNEQVELSGADRAAVAAMVASIEREG